MLVIIGGLILMVIAIFIVRYWLMGHWFASTVMFFPFAAIFAALLFSVFFSLYEAQYAKDNLAYQAAHPPRTWTNGECKASMATMTDEQFLFCTSAAPALAKLDRTQYAMGPAMEVSLSIVALLAAFCAARAPKWYWRHQADLLIHPRAPLRKLAGG